MTGITNPNLNMPEKVTGNSRARNWARCIIYRSANVRLIPVRPELSGVLAAADLHFDTGRVYLEARGLQDPATLGRDPASGQPLAYYLGWLINPNTRVYKNLGVLQPRARGGFGLEFDSDEPLEYLNLLLVTVQVREGGTQPGPLVVLAGAVCAATPVAEIPEPVAGSQEPVVGSQEPVVGSRESVAKTQEPDKIKAVEKTEKVTEEVPEKAPEEPPEKAEGKAGEGGPANMTGYPATPRPPAAYYRETVYVVQSGDTFDEIARRFGARPEILAARNFITSPNYLFPGQILFVPWPPASGTKE